MKSKPDTSMAQMGTPREVHTAIDNLHGAMLFGQKLALRYVALFDSTEKIDCVCCQAVEAGVLARHSRPVRPTRRHGVVPRLHGQSQPALLDDGIGAAQSPRPTDERPALVQRARFDDRREAKTGAQSQQSIGFV